MRAPRAGVLAAGALLAAPVAFLALFFAVPLALTLAQSVGSADAWTWIGTHPYVRSRLRVALLQALASATVTLALALPLAWLHHARRVPFSRAHLALHAAPFVLPVFVVVLGVQALLGRGGLLHDATGVDALAAVGPFGAVVIAHAYYNYGFAARLLHAALERRPRRVEDAAATLGAGRRSRALRVTLPLLLPSIASVALLAFLFAFTSFGVVLFLGEGRVGTLETLLYESMGGAFPRYDRAAAVGALQLAINLVLFLAYLALGRRASALPRERPRPAPRARAWESALAWGALALGLTPALAVLAGGFRLRGAWSLEPARAVLDPEHPAHLGGFDVWTAIGRSLAYAGAATLLAVALTVLLAYGARSTRGPARRAVETAAALPLGTSSLLVAFGYVLAFGAGSLLDLRGLALLVVVAHTLVAFPFTARALLPALDAHDRRLDEAAATLGAPPGHVARRVHWPLLAPAVLVAAGLAAAISLGDFGASLVLMRPDNMALSVWITRHGGIGAFDPMRRAQSTLLAAILMALAAGCYLAVERFRDGSEGDL